MEIQYRKSIIHQTVDGVDMETEVLLPDVPEKPANQQIGLWGLRHGCYLKKCQKAVYSSLLLSGKLDDYLWNINQQACEMYSRLFKQMMERDGITEQLKADNYIEWIRRTSSIDHAAREVVLHDLIYC